MHSEDGPMVLEASENRLSPRRLRFSVQELQIQPHSERITWFLVKRPLGCVRCPHQSLLPSGHSEVDTTDTLGTWMTYSGAVIEHP